MENNDMAARSGRGSPKTIAGAQSPFIAGLCPRGSGMKSSADYEGPVGDHEQALSAGSHLHVKSSAAQAAMTIEGEGYAAPYLERLRAGIAQPDELAVIVAYLHGELLNGFCRLVQKALEARHG